MKKIKKIASFLAIPLCVLALMSNSGCELEESSPNLDVAKSGAKEVAVKVETDLNGNTVEQNNILARYKEDNKPGSIKHLYIISSYSGQVILYSTVKGKVTSSGKRLSPTILAKISSGGGAGSIYSYNPDLIQDDGTYGGSVEYLFWFDSKGIYHQQYVTGGMILHISNEPIAVKSVTINLELNKPE